MIRCIILVVSGMIRVAQWRLSHAFMKEMVCSCRAGSLLGCRAFVMACCMMPRCLYEGFALG